MALKMSTAQCQASLVLTMFADKVNRTFNIKWYVLYSMCMPLLTGSAFHHLAEKGVLDLNLEDEKKSPGG